MKRFVKIIFLLLSLSYLLTPGKSCARDLEIKSYVDKTEMGVSDYFNLTIEISGSIGSIPNPDIPDLSDFYILSGPNESSSYQFINGAMSASKTFTFILQPKTAGEFTILPAKMKVKKVIVQTEPITIKVTSQRSSAQPPTPRTTPGKKPSAPSAKEPDDVFIRAESTVFL